MKFENVLKGFACLLLISCGDKSPAPAPFATGKAIDSRWTSEGGTTLDFSNIPFPGSAPISYLLKDGVACNCTLTNAGDATSGFYTVTRCLYVAGGPEGSGNSSCTVIQGTGTYAISGSTLTIRNATTGTSSTYHKPGAN